MQLKVVGTGFYVTRYGLFASAKHVLDELADWTNGTLLTGYVLQDDESNQMVIRRIVGISVSRTADVALGQAENGVGGPGPIGPGNLRGPVSLKRPQTGARLVSFAYPENDILDFRDPAVSPTLKGDFVEGLFRSQLDETSHPFIPYPHYETSLTIRSGASGCPIFDGGRIIGIACRGWDFRGGEHEGSELSSVLPLRQLLPIEVGCARIPTESWEFKQVPDLRRGATLSFGELITYGHVDAE